MKHKTYFTLVSENLQPSGSHNYFAEVSIFEDINQIMMLKPTVHFVNTLLDILKFFRIIKGLSLEEHRGFNSEVMPDILAVGNSLQKNVGSSDVITYPYLKQLPNFERNKI